MFSAGTVCDGAFTAVVGFPVCLGSQADASSWLIVLSASSVVLAACAAVGLCLVAMRARKQVEAARCEVEAARRNLVRARKRSRDLALMARSAKIVRDEFVANIGHEVRTPMNVILGMTDLVREGNLPPRQKHYLDRVHESGTALLGLLNDLLDFSKMQSRRLRLTAVTFRPRDCIGETVGKFASRAAAKGLALDLRVDPEVPDVLAGDAGRLSQILGALLSNAVRFTEKGGIRVQADALTHPEDTPVRLHVSVADTGIGIPAEKQDVVFEAFRQADGSATRRHGGCGLGLAIALQLTRLMGGRMWVESRVGEGSIFHTMVPFGRERRAAPRPELPSAPAFSKPCVTAQTGDSASGAARGPRVTPTACEPAGARTA